MELIEIIESKNPLVQKLHERMKLRQKRGCNKDLLKPIIKDDKKYCCWCAEVEIFGRNTKYCSEVCRTSSDVYFWPTTFGTKRILIKQNYMCNLCGYSFLEGLPKELERLKEIDEQFNKWRTERNVELRNSAQELLEMEKWVQVQRSKDHLPYDRRMELDHIVPVAAGGDVMGIDNLQAICNDCHKSKTKLDLINIRRFKLAKSNPNP